MMYGEDVRNDSSNSRLSKNKTLKCTLASELKNYNFEVSKVAKTPGPSIEKNRVRFSAYGMPKAEMTLSIPRMKPDEVRVLWQTRVFTHCTSRRADGPDACLGAVHVA